MRQYTSKCKAQQYGKVYHCFKSCHKGLKQIIWDNFHYFQFKHRELRPSFAYIGTESMIIFKLKWFHFWKWKLNNQAVASIISELRVGKIPLPNSDTHLFHNRIFTCTSIVLSGMRLWRKKSAFSYPLQKCTLWSHICSQWKKPKPLCCVCVDRKLEAVLFYSIADMKTDFFTAQK